MSAFFTIFNIHACQGLAQQPLRRVLDVNAVQLTDCSIRIDFIERWLSAGQSKQHGTVEMRPATKETDNTAACSTVGVLLHAVPFLR